MEAFLIFPRHWIPAGRVKLIFAFHVRKNDGSVMECQFAFIETLYPYFPVVQKKWWPSTAEIGTRLLYLPSPEPVVYVVPLSHILGKLPLVLAGDSGTIPCNMHGSKASCYPKGTCDSDDAPGSGSRLFYLNTWAMIWPTDYRNSDSKSPEGHGAGQGLDLGHSPAGSDMVIGSLEWADTDE
jgi:hypothetical protein